MQLPRFCVLTNSAVEVAAATSDDDGDGVLPAAHGALVPWERTSAGDGRIGMICSRRGWGPHHAPPLVGTRSRTPFSRTPHLGVDLACHDPTREINSEGRHAVGDSELREIFREAIQNLKAGGPATPACKMIGKIRAMNYYFCRDGSLASDSGFTTEARDNGHKALRPLS